MLTELKNIGLSDKEAKVYLALLHLGPASVLEVAAKAGINRPTTYVQIETLKKQGLVSSQTKGKKQLFIAESPSQLEHILDKEEKEIEVKKDDLQKILPDLTTIFNLGEEKPQVRYFEGKEGLLAMQEEFLKVKEKEVLGIFSIDEIFELFPNHSSDYSERRIKKAIRSRIIYTSRKGPILKVADKASLRKSKFIQPEKMPFTADITIFDNNVAVSSLKGKVGGSIITDKTVANSFRVLFRLIWDSV
jgi:HTH-type transcriptional regulator, sugar sensing transcriptional regulator